MSNANGLSPFRGEIKGFILPVSHYKGHVSQRIKIVAEPKVAYEKKIVNDDKPTTQEKQIHEANAIDRPKIKIDNTHLEKGVSSLSISSIKLKREAALKSSLKKIEVNEAQDNFTQENFIEVWNHYIKNKNLQGENNIAALLEMSKPELSEDFTVLLKTSNSLSQLEIKKEIPALLAHLGEKLNNFKIKFDIRIEEQKNQAYIYGVKEKYDHLMKINPEIEVLKKEFDLDL